MIEKKIARIARKRLGLLADPWQKERAWMCAHGRLVHFGGPRDISRRELWSKIRPFFEHMIADDEPDTVDSGVVMLQNVVLQ